MISLAFELCYHSDPFNMAELDNGSGNMSDNATLWDPEEEIRYRRYEIAAFVLMWIIFVVGIIGNGSAGILRARERSHADHPEHVSGELVRRRLLSPHRLRPFAGDRVHFLRSGPSVTERSATGSARCTSS